MNLSLAILAALILMAGLASLAGRGGQKRIGGPRGSEEATIRVRNGSLMLELRDDTTAEWEEDSNAKEWTQRGKSKKNDYVEIDISHSGDCTKDIPKTANNVRVVHVQGVIVDLKVRGKKTRVKAHGQGRLTHDSNNRRLVYKPASGADYISEIWIDGARICTFEAATELTYLDLKREKEQK